MTKKILCLLLGIGYAFFADSQAMLSGIINDYAAVRAIDTCANTLTLSRTDGFQAGGQAVLIQMQGATMSTENSPAFGDIVAPGGAGLYEKVAIQSMDGNEVRLANKLLHDYDPDGAVQLVSMPVFDRVVVTGTLRASPWNGNTGGVIALEVRDTLRLEADIDASGSGFRGGLANGQAASNCNFAQNIRGYAWPSGDWRGAAKGEGVARWIIGLEAGRGAQANGGGGGNDHNAGGGGGGHLTRGGRGGRNNEPSFFGCSGPFPGDGGKTLSADTARLYLGGGGGAGDENNDVASDGGAGGGILIISAAVLASNGFAFKANGSDAEDAPGLDGAGGGGAGGAILLSGETLIGSLSIEAKGGKGGDVDNLNQDRCFGAGGGGGGGRYLGPSAWSPTVDLSGGAAGQSLNSMAAGCGSADNAAGSGDSGLRQDKSGLPEGQTLFVEPRLFDVADLPPACEGAAWSAAVGVEGDLELQWQVERNGMYMDLSEGSPYAGVNAAELHVDPVDGQLAGSRYRLRATSNCGEVLFSEPVVLQVRPLPTAAFSVVQNEREAAFTNQSVDALSYTWFFGDGARSEEENPVHVYVGSGVYEVTFIARNDCGADTLRRSLEVSVATPPQAAFSFDPTSGCPPLRIQFTNESTGDFSEVRWRFPGGEPATSAENSPAVIYETSGRYSFTLEVSGAFGRDTLVATAELEILPLPTAGFTFSAEDRTVRFEQQAIGGTTYRWLFGDGEESTEANPLHSYEEYGGYEVALIVGNDCGMDTLRQNLVVGEAPRARYTFEPAGGCAPAEVQFFNRSAGNVSSFEWVFPGGNPSTSTEANPIVSYNTPGAYGVRLYVQGPLGIDELETENTIEILPIPEPAFDYEIRGDTLILENQSTNAESYRWNFGDGTTSREENPIHVYAQSGVFDVTLNAANKYCGKSTARRINAMATSTEEALRAAGISLYPNPVSDMLNLEVSDPALFPLEIMLFNGLGQRLRQWQITASEPLSLSSYPPGAYYVALHSEQGAWVVRILKQ